MIIFIFFAICFANNTNNFSVERHISTKILNEKYSNETDIRSILYERNYLDRIKYVYRKFNINMDIDNIINLWIPYFPEYGLYCGYYNTDSLMRLPYDGIDNLCRTYKVCNGNTDYNSCFCNLQFYLNILNYKHVYDYEKYIKNHLITYLKEIVHICHDISTHNTSFVYQISNNSNNGLNLLTFCNNNYEKFYTISSDDTFYFFQFNSSYLKILTNYTYISNDNETYIILNPHNNTIKINVITKKYISNWCNISSFFNGSIIILGLLITFILIIFRKN